MGTDLFRREALEAAGTTTVGEAGNWVPKSHALGAIAAACVVGLVCAFIGCAHYTRRYHSEGLIVPRHGLLISLSPTNGTVEKILVPEGSHVEKGQAIAVIASPRRDSHGNNASDAASAQLRAQLIQLDIERQSANDRSETFVRALRKQRDDLVHQQAQARIQQEAQQKDRDANAALLARIEPLASKGFVSAFQVQQQRSAVSNSDLQVQAFRRQRFELDRQLHSLDEQIANSPRDAAEAAAKNQRNIAQLRQALADSQANGGTVVVAAAGGTVSAINVQSGQAVSAAQAVASITPDGSALNGRMFVDGSVAAHVRPGQRVALRLPAFPYQKYGLLYGTVLAVTSTGLTPAEVSAVLGDKPPEKTTFRVDVALDRDVIVSEGESHRILPGMQLEADVLGDRRRLIEWIVEPLNGFQKQWNAAQEAGEGIKEAQ